MAQLQTFLAMGDYGVFVWPAYGATALIMIWLLAATLRRLRGLERTLAEHGIAPPGGGAARGGAARGGKGAGDKEAAT